MTSQIMDIQNHTDVKILGFHFTNKVNTSAIETWSTVTTRVSALAQDTYYRDLSLDRRIHFVPDYLLAKIWFVAQIYPTCRMHTAAQPHDIMVHLARGNIQGSTIHPPAWENGRGGGTS